MLSTLIALVALGFVGHQVYVFAMAKRKRNARLPR